MEKAAQFAAEYKNASSAFLPLSRPVVRAKRFIREHFADNTIGLKDIAKYAEVSNGYMSTIFKQETGENVLDFLARVRVDRAQKLLHETNLLVAEVAERTGFVCLVFANGTYAAKKKVKAAKKIVIRTGDNMPDRNNGRGAVLEKINAAFRQSHPGVEFETESYADQPWQEKAKTGVRARVLRPYGNPP